MNSNIYQFPTRSSKPKEPEKKFFVLQATVDNAVSITDMQAEEDIFSALSAAMKYWKKAYDADPSVGSTKGVKQLIVNIMVQEE